MSIGLLFGDSPWSLEEDARTVNPIITAADVDDARAAFVADPFAFEKDGVWFLFFEIMNRDSGKGEISYASSTDLLDWKYGQRVLVEPFHLSYPGIYAFEGEIWMVPESWESQQVRLYRAESFPTRWVLEEVLLEGIPGTDPTLRRRPDGGFSMLLCAARSEIHNRTLLRFDAPGLRGPWTESSESPIIVDDSSQARPGGHCFDFGGVSYRLAQDCSTRYGESLRSFPLDQSLSTEGTMVLRCAGDGWRSRGAHHADIHVGTDGRLIAFVDGESQG